MAIDDPDKFPGNLKNGIGGSSGLAQTVIIRGRRDDVVLRWLRKDLAKGKSVLTVLLHNGQNLDDDLGGRSDQDLSLSSSLGVDDVVQAVVKNRDSDHFDGFFEGSMEGSRSVDCRSDMGVWTDRSRYAVFPPAPSDPSLSSTSMSRHPKKDLLT